MNRLKDRISKLSPAKRALVVEKLNRAGAFKENKKIISPRVNRDSVPLSFSQERLWFLGQLEPGNVAYNRPVFIRLTGPLNVDSLNKSLNEIIRRHEILRATFHESDGKPTQIVSPNLTVEIPVVDLSGYPEKQKEPQALTLAREETQIRFDLSQGPILRAKLFGLADEHHILLLVIHHIAFDAWSSEVLIKELTALYDAFSKGSASPLPELPIQYADFAHWQRGYLQEEVLKNLLSYWEEKLSGVPPRLNTPTDRPRPSIQTHRGARRSMILPPSLLKSLKSLSAQYESTLFMTLLSAFKTLLYRYTGEKDIVVGSPIAGRNNIKTEELIGLFINTLVLRTDLGGSPTFRGLLGRVREVVREALEHHDLPFEQLVEALNPERDLGSTPLVQVMFNLENIARSSIEIDGLKLEACDLDSGASPFDISMEMMEDSGGLRCSAVYNTDLFDEATILRMLGHYRTLLEAIVSNPEESIEALPLLTESERQQMLFEWNDTKRGYPGDKSIHRLFEEQAEKMPDAIAVVFEENVLTYKELNNRANQLAHHLISVGVGPEVLVGICVERSLEMIVGILGILKAGGAYVPLDPWYPTDRLSLMLEQTNLPVLLTKQRIIKALPAPKANLVVLDLDAYSITVENCDNPDTALGLENLAYIIHTSGSTGMPKGIQIEHRQILNYVDGIANRLGLEAGAGFAMVQPLTVDSSQTVIFPSLISGGCLHIIPEDRVSDAEYLKNYFSRERIDLLKIAPTHLTALEGSADAGKILPRRWLVIGGEALRWQLIGKLQAMSPCEIYNHYGPTETTVGVLTNRIEDKQPASGSSNVPVGVPTPNTKAYVLNSSLQPVPIGVPGEIYIGWSCLARGYLNRPDLTAEVFLPDPFSVEPGERLYKTGDIARFLSDGKIEFLGRADNQVKIRGYRVELGEIESALGKHPDIRDVAVSAFEHTPLDRRLVAYVVPRENSPPALGGTKPYELSNNLPMVHLNKHETDYIYRARSEDQEYARYGSRPSNKEMLIREQEKSAHTISIPVLEDREFTVSKLRAYLKDKLPSYMVPSEYIVLKNLPRTPQGKINRRELPTPDIAGPEMNSNFLAPRTPVEELIANIWGEVLGIKQVGIHDDFFEWGGYSLLVTQMISKLRDAFHLDIPLQRFIENPSVAGLSEVVEEALMDGNAPGHISIPRAARAGEAPPSFSQERVWFIHQLNPYNLAYNTQATLIFGGPLNAPALEQSLSELVRRHEIFRTTFPSLNGRPVQQVHPFEPLRLPMIDLEYLPEDLRDAEADRLIAEEFRRPFNLTQLPLVRWKLLRLDEQKHILLHVEHHIIHDGWSFNLFLKELLELYKAFSSAKPSPLPDLPIQFTDFAVWQRNWIKGEEANRQLKYWQEKLAGCTSYLELPFDRPRPPVQGFRGKKRNLRIPSTLWESLKRFSSQKRVTTFMTMVTAFITLLYRYSGQNDICVGSGIANRRSSETETLIGMIINSIVLRTDLSGNPTFRELLYRVRKTAFEAYSNQDLPFDMIVDVLRPKRDISRNPLFQVMFSFQDTPRPPIELPGLNVTLNRPIDNGSSKLDLNIIVYPPAEPRSAMMGKMTTDPTIVMSWEYNTDLFDEETVFRMISKYLALLEIMVSYPEQSISTVSITTEEERHGILIEWNDTEREYPKDKCIHQLFEEQVERTPDAIAVVFEERFLTYRELNNRANRLAHNLVSLGVDSETLVGICVERSLDMVVGLLGILKAGGAYVPLDPSYPKDRLSIMLEDVDLSVLLTQQNLLKSLPSHEATVVLLDAEPGSIASENYSNPKNNTAVESLAYVIFTSGSTGRPKGVCITHKGVVRLVKGVEYASLGSEEVFLQFAPLSFDASTFEIWGSLLNGARLVMFPAYMPSLEELGKVIQANEVTTLWLTAGLFHQMIDEPLEYLSSVRQLLAGGDVLSPLHVRKAVEELTACRIINGYGPTEGTTFTCCYPMIDANQIDGSVPIGNPIANTQVYILDSHLELVPVGVKGELYIGGAGLARCYLNNPDFTAEKFIPNPFSGEPEARLYRTGDRARYRAEGTIEFLGRLDQQVKIRGFRVELGEIEKVLGQHPGVEDCVVVAREDQPAGKRLIAYVIPSNGSPLSIGELRTYLKQKLPEYMLPGAFVLMDSFPLTPNGKIDREALPAPDESRPDVGDAYVPPGNPVEEVLAGIWAEVLGIDRVGVRDDFFELGGHSLLATQVVSRIRSIFQVDFPLRIIFDAPTIKGLAHWILNSPIDPVMIEPTAQRNQTSSEPPESKVG